MLVLGYHRRPEFDCILVKGTNSNVMNGSGSGLLEIVHRLEILHEADMGI